MKLLKESARISLKLLKIMLPISILVKVGSNFGIIDFLSKALTPLMGIMGLSGEMGIVWATALITNIYGGILVLLTMAQNNVFTVAEITIVASIMLFAHSLPVELKVISETGAKPWKILCIRISCAVISGVCLNLLFKFFNIYQETAVFKFTLKESNPGIISWILGELKKYTTIFVIIFVLLALMEGLKKIGIIDWINKKFSPVMSFMGIDPGLSLTCIVGLTMGVSYGSGLIIKETREGDYSKRDLFLVAVFISLCHALIEDTLLMIPLGAKMIGIFWGRIFFAAIFTIGFNKILPKNKKKK
ncbi:nucleoside recognition domain-containing protein [Psychrilyobacter sp.]|uniref:nucleoside recognition domain-containing protein n=1 Tax=Psychrilyobacter sp. TaxID=2586924 RepID=UPI003016CB7D